MDDSIADKYTDVAQNSRFTLLPMPLVESEHKVEGYDSIERVARLTDTEVHDIAWDLVLYGDDTDRVLEANNLTRADYEVLKTLPLFAQETSNARRMLADDPHAPLRRMARQYLVGRMQTLNELACSDMVEPTVRVKAVELIAKLAGVNADIPQSKQQGVAVQINFGGQLGATLEGSVV